MTGPITSYNSKCKVLVASKKLEEPSPSNGISSTLSSPRNSREGRGSASSSISTSQITCREPRKSREQLDAEVQKLKVQFLMLESEREVSYIFQEPDFNLKWPRDQILSYRIKIQRQGRRILELSEKYARFLPSTRRRETDSKTSRSSFNEEKENKNKQLKKEIEDLTQQISQLKEEVEAIKTDNPQESLNKIALQLKSIFDENEARISELQKYENPKRPSPPRRLALKSCLESSRSPKIIPSLNPGVFKMGINTAPITPSSSLNQSPRSSIDSTGSISDDSGVPPSSGKAKAEGIFHRALSVQGGPKPAAQSPYNALRRAQAPVQSNLHKGSQQGIKTTEKAKRVRWTNCPATNGKDNRKKDEKENTTTNTAPPFTFRTPFDSARSRTSSGSSSTIDTSQPSSSRQIRNPSKAFSKYNGSSLPSKSVKKQENDTASLKEELASLAARCGVLMAEILRHQKVSQEDAIEIVDLTQRILSQENQIATFERRYPNIEEMEEIFQNFLRAGSEEGKPRPNDRCEMKRAMSPVKKPAEKSTSSEKQEGPPKGLSCRELQKKILEKTKSCEELERSLAQQRVQYNLNQTQTKLEKLRKEVAQNKEKIAVYEGLKNSLTTEKIFLWLAGQNTLQKKTIEQYKTQLKVMKKEKLSLDDTLQQLRKENKELAATNAQLEMQLGASAWTHNPQEGISGHILFDFPNEN